MFKPLIPAICDFFDHNFAEAEHISTVHSLYGSNHVEKSMASDVADSKSNGKHHSGQADNQLPAHVFIAQVEDASKFGQVVSQYPEIASPSLAYACLLRVAPPPKFWQ